MNFDYFYQYLILYNFRNFLIQEVYSICQSFTIRLPDFSIRPNIKNLLSVTIRTRPDSKINTGHIQLKRESTSIDQYQHWSVKCWANILIFYFQTLIIKDRIHRHSKPLKLQAISKNQEHRSELDRKGKAKFDVFEDFCIFLIELHRFAYIIQF